MTYDGSSKASGVKIYIDGALQEQDVPTDKLKNTIRTGVPLKLGQRRSSSAVEKAGLQDLRIYGRVLKAEEVKSLSSGARLAWLVSNRPRAGVRREGRVI